LHLERRLRDLALFNLAIDSKLRGCDATLMVLQYDIYPEIGLQFAPLIFHDLRAWRPRQHDRRLHRRIHHQRVHRRRVKLHGKRQCRNRQQAERGGGRLHASSRPRAKQALRAQEDRHHEEQECDRVAPDRANAAIGGCVFAQ
jgi:hypothetical protein